MRSGPLHDPACGRRARSDRVAVLIDGESYYRALYHAAQLAEDHILLCGWQFDSEVALLRGDDASGHTPERVRLVPMLEALCRERPRLHVYILAWDYSLLFAAERELAQRLVFGAATSERIHFVFDSNHPAGASHHQKLVVIDRAIAFVGSMDVCASRWDRRRHAISDPDRINTRHLSYDPYHEVQLAVSGEVVGVLADMFAKRWRAACGQDPRIGDAGGVSRDALRALVSGDVDGSPSEVLVSVTRGPHGSSGGASEVLRLYEEAISSAKRLLYFETQYFTSTAIHDALVSRFSDASEPLSVVVVLPRELRGTARFALEAAQRRVITSLRRSAAAGGHALGVYYSAALHRGQEVPTYVHSKVLIVDDALVSIGSANLTNRSMALDTELNATWHVRDDDESARRLRCSLLSEHAGADVPEQAAGTAGLVGYLETLAKEPSSKLRVHPDVLRDGDEGALPVSTMLADPDRPLTEIELDEILDAAGLGAFAKGISHFDAWLREKGR